MSSKNKSPDEPGRGNPRGEAPRPKSQMLIFYLVIAAVCLTFLFAVQDTSPGARIDYNEVLRRVVAGEVAKVSIGESRIEITLTESAAAQTEGGRSVLYADYIHSGDPGIVDRLADKDVKISWERQGGLATFLKFWIVPLLFLGLIFFLMTRQMGRTESVLSFGKSKARVIAEEDITTRFDDVAGVEEAKEELLEIADFLSNPSKYSSLGGNIPKGVLLVGPPGCGKTLIARALAGEAGVPFFSISGSDFVEMFVGVGASRVRDLFIKAKAKAPCIIFIDEIDAVGRQRGAGIGGGHDEREQTLNQLLVEMDGFDTEKGTIILAATNRPDVLDPALLRPGRFDRRVTVDHPDHAGRLQILKVHSRNKPMAEDVELESVANRTPGFSGADLENVANEAALLAARRGQDKLQMKDFEDAVERVVAGPERRSKLISDREKLILAYHELGHALTAFRCKHADPVQKVSIIPRGHAALGYTLQIPAEDRYIISREELIDRITGLLGGRAAEEVRFGMQTTGAQNDIERASSLARQMVSHWGMGKDVGLVHYGSPEREVFLGRGISQERNYSDETARTIDREVAELIESCHKRAYEILDRDRALLDALAVELIKRETMSGDEIRKMLEGETLPEFEEVDRTKGTEEAKSGLDGGPQVDTVG